MSQPSEPSYKRVASEQSRWMKVHCHSSTARFRLAFSLSARTIPPRDRRQCAEVGSRNSPRATSGLDQATALWFGDRIAKFLRRVDPQAHRILRISERLLLSHAMGGTARKLRYFRNKRSVFGAPVDDDLVFDHSLSPSLAFKIIARTCFT